MATSGATRFRRNRSRLKLRGTKGSMNFTFKMGFLEVVWSFVLDCRRMGRHFCIKCPWMRWCLSIWMISWVVHSSLRTFFILMSNYYPSVLSQTSLENSNRSFLSRSIFSKTSTRFPTIVRLALPSPTFKWGKIIRKVSWNSCFHG